MGRSELATERSLSQIARIWCATWGLVFLACFVATFVARKQIETAAHAYLVNEVTVRVQEKLGVAQTESLKTKSGAMRSLLKANERKVRKLIDSELPEMIGEALAAHRGCAARGEEKAGAVAGAIGEGARPQLEKIGKALGGPKVLTLGFYEARLDALLGEIRKFTGINAALYAVCLVLLTVRVRNPRGLLLPVGLLAVSSAIAAILYLSSQNWFWTVLTNNYMGWGYLGVVGVVLGFLTDIVLNRGRVTEMVLNAVSSAVSAPC